MTSRVGVVLFPGSNCEHDAAAAGRGQGGQAGVARQGDSALGRLDAVVRPGGVAHGDYVPPGAVARFSPVMEAVHDFVAAGGPVVGICNGFQVLTEAGLLPGAFQKNRGLKFLCTMVEVRVETTNSVLTSQAEAGQILRIPVNHFQGNFTCPDGVLAQLRAQNRIVLRYVENPNGSTDSIAGVCNEGGNVVGLMPHPERASDALLGSEDGIPLLRSLLDGASTYAAAS